MVQKAPPPPISGNLPPIGRRLRRGGDRDEPAWMGAERSGATKARRMDGRGAERSDQGTPHGSARSVAERVGAIVPRLLCTRSTTARPAFVPHGCSRVA